MIDLQLIRASLPDLLLGLRLTVLISSVSCCIGLLFGVVLALGQVYGITPIRLLISVYITIVRGTPMLIQILGAYYLLPTIGFTFSATGIAIFAIGCNSAAYISQIVRAGINSVGEGQVEAAVTLGFSRLQIIRFIVLPQAIRVIFPALASEFITLIKDSSLASVIGASELLKQGRSIISQTYDAITIFFLLAILYLLLTGIISVIAYALERSMRRPC